MASCADTQMAITKARKVSDRVFRAEAVKRGYAHWEIITDSDRSEPKPRARFAWNTQVSCQACKGSGICGYGSFGHYASYPVPCEYCQGQWDPG
jgi:DnaJ-class molecular chaperone